MKVKTLSPIRLLATPWTAAYQAPPPWDFLGKSAGVGCHCLLRNSRLDEAQAGIKIVRRNVNNLRYADETTLMEESEEDLNSLLMKGKEESGKSWLKTQH